jgi:hypothetical protein
MLKGPVGEWRRKEPRNGNLRDAADRGEVQIEVLHGFFLS